MKVLNKITLKTIECQPKPNKVASEIPLATIYGMATGYKLGTSNYGEFCKFLGDFRAIRASDNVEFRSGALLLPATVASLMQVAVDKAGDTGVQFGLLIGVKPSEVPIGYEYTIEPIINTDHADPLAALHEQVMKQLAGPVKPEKTKHTK